MQQEPGTRPPASPEHLHRPAWIDSVPGSVLVAVTAVLAVLVGVVLSASEPSVAAGAASTPPAAPSTTRHAAPSTAAAAPAQAAEEAQLRAEAARLTARVHLSAPPAWARWGAARAAYPEDVDGCPRLAARLTAALGTAMRYSEGTLPGGPYGCTWVPASSSPGPYAYGGRDGNAYRLDVGWLADGTTTATLRTASYEHGDTARCPGTNVPAVGAGAVLVRCEEQTAVELTLALPNAVGQGVWLLHAQARDGARHTPVQALAALVDAVGHTYG